ncbi:hypothetical protein [Aneurinibacillus tyrosinisolvens]|nr:hypothetical protein [Aneurinibacillus tyrosinisolvens]
MTNTQDNIIEKITSTKSMIESYTANYEALPFPPFVKDLEH